MITKTNSTRLASIVGASHIGEDVEITGVNRPDMAGVGEIFFLESKYKSNISQNATIALTTEDLLEFLPESVKTTLVVKDVRTILPKLSQALHLPKKYEHMIHHTASVDPSASVDASCHIAQNVIICAGAKIGKNAVISANCYVGENVEIGDNTIIYPSVYLYDDTIVGKDCVLSSGVVIGSDGFGFTPINGKFEKRVHLSYVKIGDSCEIGANTCIDRGFVSPTIIGSGVKLDNIIQIGHNAEIGENTVISGGTLIAGSTKIGRNCMVGGGSKISDHISIVDNVVLAGGSQVGSNIRQAGIYGSFWSVRPITQWKKIHALIDYLPGFFSKIKKNFFTRFLLK